MKKFLTRSLVYLIMTMLVLPVSVMTTVGAQKAKAEGRPTVEVNVNKDQLSPDLAGTRFVTIDLAFSTAVSVNMDIVNAQDQKIVDLYDSSSVTDPDEKNWYGRDSKNSLGNIVPDGIYKIKVSYHALSDPDLIYVDQSKTITIDTKAPDVRIVKTPNQPISTNFTFEIISDETNSFIEYSWENNSNWNTYTGPISKSNFGTYYLYARATDLAGNRSVVDDEDDWVSFKIEADNTTPVIDPIKDIVATDEFEVKINAKDLNPLSYLLSQASGLGQLVITQDATDPSLFRVKADINGSYELTAIATDSASNSSSVNFKLDWVAEANITKDQPTVKLILGTTGSGEIIVDPAVENPVLDLSEFLTPIYGAEETITGQTVVLQNTALKVKTVINGVPVTLSIGSEDGELAITGPAVWDGTINLPTAAELGSVILPNNQGFATGKTLTLKAGIAGGTLSFDGLITFTFAGQAGARVGYVADGGTFVEVLDKSDEVSDFKTVSNEGSDLDLAVNHLTTFVVYKEIVPAPDFAVTTVTKDGVKYVRVEWASTGADKYYITMNGTNYIVENVAGQTKYTFDKEVGYGKFEVLVRGFKAGVYSTNTETKTIEFNEPVATVVAPTVTVEPVVPSVAPAKAKAAVNPQPAEQKVETPTDDQGIIKGDEKKEDTDETNWTPWIILLILIILAGAATGGYFYWFAGKDEQEDKTKKPVKKEKVAVTVREKQKKPSNKKTKRW